MAILALQYLSSFTDIGNVQTPETVPPKQLSNNDSGFYIALEKSITDSISRDCINNVWSRYKNIAADDANEIYVQKIMELQDSSKRLSDKNADTDAIASVQREITYYRRHIKLESSDNIPGLSLISYFKFAIIISQLSFICGYDPSIFGELLQKWGFEKSKDPPEKPTDS